MTFKRADGRKSLDIRTIDVSVGVQKHAEGSVLFAMGDTRVVCAATIEERVPPFLRGAGKGWVTAEYSMLPRATNTRVAREGRTGKVGGAPTRSSGWWGGRCGRWSTSKRSASAP